MTICDRSVRELACGLFCRRLGYDAGDAFENVLGRDRDDLERLRRDLGVPLRHRSHARRQVKLKGLTPAKFRGQALQKAALRS